MLKLFRRPFLLLFLLGPYLVSTMGIAAYFFAFQYRHTFQELIRSSSRDNLKQLNFTEEEFRCLQWTDEDNHEFSWEGKMYDVSHVVKTQAGYTIYCEHDSFEDAVLAWMKMNGEKSKSKNGTVIHFCEVTEIFVCKINVEELLKGEGQLNQLYKSLPRKLTTPPPRFI